LSFDHELSGQAWRVLAYLLGNLEPYNRIRVRNQSKSVCNQKHKVLDNRKAYRIGSIRRQRLGPAGGVSLSDLYT